MHLVIDGYNLLHVTRSLLHVDSNELQRERDALVEELAAYARARCCEITVVFDGWQAGRSTEKKEQKKRIELIFSRLGEKADEVIKRLVREKGSAVIVITSDREISRHAERLSVAWISSERFRDKLDQALMRSEWPGGEREYPSQNKKGPSRTLSKRDKRAKAVLKKL
jgi:uncharacterized protein